jgi:hypothetical protein
MTTVAWLRWVGVILALVLFLLGPGVRPAEAHQPRLVTTAETVMVRDPGISQAFYAELLGQPALYRVDLAVSSQFYFSLLVPDLPQQRTDFTAVLLAADGNPERTLEVLDGPQHEWQSYFEPFAGDSYLRGPEAELPLAVGSYLVRVSNPDNAGKYVLSVGRKERFGFAGTLQTAQRLPEVKRFFGKSPWTAFLNVFGAFLLIGVVAVAAGLVLAGRWIAAVVRQR